MITFTIVIDTEPLPGGAGAVSLVVRSENKGETNTAEIALADMMKKTIEVTMKLMKEHISKTYSTVILDADNPGPIQASLDKFIDDRIPPQP